MPFLYEFSDSRKVANLSHPEFAKNFALCYKKYKLDELYGLRRRIAHNKFVKEMQQKHGYYQQVQPKLYTSDKYWSRLKPKNWSTSRLNNWNMKHVLFFEKITSESSRKIQEKRMVDEWIIPILPNQKEQSKKSFHVPRNFLQLLKNNSSTFFSLITIINVSIVATCLVLEYNKTKVDASIEK